jgi:hypothetical protein
MTILEDTLARLNEAMPPVLCPFQVQVGDLVWIKNEHLPVIITDGHLDGVCRVLEYVSEARKSNEDPVFEGSQPFEPGEPIILVRRAARGVAL